MAVDSIDKRDHAAETLRPAAPRRTRPTLLTVAAVCVIAAALAVVGWARLNTVPQGRTYTVVEPPPAAAPSAVQPLVPLLPPKPSTSAAAHDKPSKAAHRAAPAAGTPPRPGRPRAVSTGAITGFLGRCLRVPDGSATAGIPVEMSTCDGSAGERWTLAADGTYRAQGLCLEVNGAEVADGARVQMGTCDGTAGQQWKATDGRDVVNPHADKCLDVVDFNPLDSAGVQIWSCVAGANQKWAVPAA